MKYKYNIDMSSDNSLSLILRQVKPGSRILEFGPALGYMTQYLKEELGCIVYCVEIDADAASIASQFCDKMIVADLDELEYWGSQLGEQQFDFLIFADVLEHLRDPWNVLTYSKKFLDEGGKVLTSIPNIGHNAVIMKLLLGEFDYTNLGLLDNTHIRFFTRKSVHSLMEHAGLEIVDSYESVLKPEETELRQRYSDFPNSLQKYLQRKSDSDVYQFINVSRKKIVNSKEVNNYVNEVNPYHQASLKFTPDFQGETEVVSLPSNGGYTELSFKVVGSGTGQLNILIDCIAPAFLEITKLEFLDENNNLILDWFNPAITESLLRYSEGAIKLPSMQTRRFLILDESTQIICDFPEIKRTKGIFKITLCLSEDVPTSIAGEVNGISELIASQKNEIASLIERHQLKEQELSEKDARNRSLIEELTGIQEVLLYEKDELVEKVNKAEEANKVLVKANLEANALVNQLLNSTSWKFTKPLRVINEYNKALYRKSNSAIKSIIKPMIVKAENSKTIRKAHGKFFNVMRRTPEPFRSQFKKTYYKLLSLKTKIKYKPEANLVTQVNTSEKNEYPLVSIIIPVYNNVEYLASCIDSAINQTYRHVEVIIVDDCSPDPKVSSILNTYKNNKKVRLFKNEYNQGISKTQNICMAKSEGSIIAFLDCDDILELNAIEKCLEYWEPGTKYSFTNRIHINEDSEEIGRFSCDHLPKDNIFEDHLDVRMYASHFKMISRDVFLKVGVFNSEYDGAQDYDMVLRVAFHYPNSAFVHVPEFLYKHRIHTNQKSIKSNDKQKNMSIVISDQAKLRRSIRDGVFHKLISFIMISFGKEDQTLQCIQSIKNTVKIPHEIILFENGSSESCVSFIKEHIEGIPGVKVIYNSSNLGPAGGRKEAMKYATPNSYYISLDNDIEVTEGWLEELLVRAEESDDIGSVTCRVTFPSNVLQFTGGYEEISGNRVQFKLYNINKSVYDLSTLERYDTDWNPVGATLFKGWFPEVEGYPNVYEDSAISYLLRNSGKRLVNSPNSLLIHHHIMFDEERNKKEQEYIRFRYNPQLMLRSLAQFYFDYKLIIADDYIYSSNNIDISKLSDQEVIETFENIINTRRTVIK
ncbi:glycosyltransferase [Paenibacillus lautus]